MNKKKGENLILIGLKRSKPEVHWGDWIKARSSRVGYRRQRDLADAIGCERTLLYKWFKMALPPVRVKKGFDTGLASALRTDREMLFHAWRFTTVEEAPLVDRGAGDGAYSERQSLSDELFRTIPIIGIGDLKAVVEFARQRHRNTVDKIIERLRIEAPKSPTKK